LGKYSLIKKAISYLLFLTFYTNVFNRGDNIILLAKKRNIK